MQADNHNELTGEHKAPIPAAQYIRMSTEHQQYSTENQAKIISEYGARRGYQIVETFTDGGKSGLVIQGRDALKRLIELVQNGNPHFRAILVYDISRWGRFLDADESAYYEYICKRAGIDIHYCAEQFENDGSIQATIIKNVKRAMAGEYSRELSVKVFQGQCNLIEKGFRQGGPAGFGLRRLLIDQSGQPKNILGRGEQKSLQTDRVILVPGPKDEIKVVCDIYEMFVRQGKRESEIAEILNAQGIKTDLGRPWTRATVRQVLTNEKYIGNNVYNRISFKLKRKRVRNPPDMWVRADGVFDPIVDPQMFFMAQGILAERNRRFTDEEMLELLKRLLDKHGQVSAHVIDNAEGTPSSGAYRSRFGSLIRAYQLVGYTPDHDYTYLEINRRLREIYPDLMDQTIGQLESVGAIVEADRKTNQLRINGEYSASLVMSRCRKTPLGSLRWVVRFHSRPMPDITVLVRMDPENEQPADFFLMPLIDVRLPKVRLYDWNPAYVESYRCDTLDRFAQLALRTRIQVPA